MSAATPADQDDGARAARPDDERKKELPPAEDDAQPADRSAQAGDFVAQWQALFPYLMPNTLLKPASGGVAPATGAADGAMTDAAGADGAMTDAAVAVLAPSGETLDQLAHCIAVGVADAGAPDGGACDFTIEIGELGTIEARVAVTGRDVRVGLRARRESTRLLLVQRRSRIAQQASREAGADITLAVE